MPQNFTDVTFNDNIQLYGHLNGYDLPELFADTISVHEPAILPYVIFGNNSIVISDFKCVNNNRKFLLHVDCRQLAANWPLKIHSLADNVIFKKSLNIGGTLSGIRIPDDLILSQSDSLQNFNVPVTFASDVKIVGTLTIGDKLNGFNLGKMCELLESPQPYAAPQKLTIRGDSCSVQFNL